MQNFEAEMISNTPNFKILKYCVVLISRREAGLGLRGGGERTPYIRHGKKEFNASEGYEARIVTKSGLFWVCNTGKKLSSYCILADF
jgi:hypothetical protein